MSDRKNDGGPAFPFPSRNSGPGEWHVYAPGSNGMSLRDYFAAAMVTGFAMRSDDFTHVKMAEMAEWAYDLADAMIVARRTTEGGS